MLYCAVWDSYGDVREPWRKLLGDELGQKIKSIWGLNEEGEINSCWRDSGVPGLYCMMGNLALCRFHSKHLALRECVLMLLDDQVLRMSADLVSMTYRDQGHGRGDIRGEVLGVETHWGDML